jgi:hypothetical protein
MSIEQYIEKPRVFDGAENNIKKANIFRRVQNKLNHATQFVDNLNDVCKIEYSGDTVVGFTPRINLKKFGGRGNRNVFLESRKYVADLLKKLGFKVNVYKDEDDSDWPNSSVYINLKDTENLKLMQRLGSLFNFYYKRPLQQADLEGLIEKGSR